MRRIDINQIAKENIAFFINDEIALIEDLHSLQSIGLLEKDFLIDGYALVLLLNGHMDIDLADAHQHIGSGNIIICRPNDLLSHVMVSIDFEFRAFFCSLEIGDEIAKEKSSQRPFYSIFKTQPGVIRATGQTMTMCEKTYELFKLCLTNNSLSNKRQITDALYLTLVRIIEEALVNDKQVTDNKKNFTSAEVIFSRFLQIIEHSKVKRRSVAEYAEMLNISPKYFSNVCSLVAGKSANAIINDYIIKDATLLLHDHKKTVKEIALKLGFVNQSHFGSFFRHLKGMSPHQFRKKL